jgi:flagellar protein FliJ
MKKFKFRLEPVMRYREFLERQKQLEVAKARSDVVTCEASIERTRSAFIETVGELEKEAGLGMDAARFLQFRGYMSGLEAFEASEIKRRSKLLGVLVERQKELTKKSVEKKVMEKLKVRYREEYYTAMFKEEQKGLDDMIVIRGTGNDI